MQWDQHESYEDMRTSGTQELSVGVRPVPQGQFISFFSCSCPHPGKVIKKKMRAMPPTTLFSDEAYQTQSQSLDCIYDDNVRCTLGAPGKDVRVVKAYFTKRFVSDQKNVLRECCKFETSENKPHFIARRISLSILLFDLCFF